MENTNETYNIHIKGMGEMLVRYCEEISKSQSAGVSALNVSDKRRLLSYLAEFRSYIEWVYALQADENGGFLDLPESHPRLRTVEGMSELPEVENNHIRDILEYLVTTFEELMSCQSSRLGAGVISHDFDRVVAVLDTLDSYIENFIESNSPMDLPESSPRRAMVAPGKKGSKRS